MRAKKKVFVGIGVLSSSYFIVIYLGGFGQSSVQKWMNRRKDKFSESQNKISFEVNDRTTINQDVICSRNTLQGRVNISWENADRNYWTELGERRNPDNTSKFLGVYSTKNLSLPYDSVAYDGLRSCDYHQYVAIIIPFRDRESHLRILIGHLMKILKKQGNGFSIFVVEQIGNGTFNKGRIMNTGFQYAKTVGEQNGTPFDCYIFHDVDLLAENDRMLYQCSGNGSMDHYSTTIDKFQYRTLCCGITVGGAMGMPREQFELVNGFPNDFWGWGGEDDAIYDRILSRKIRINRPNPELGRFTMIKHAKDVLNPSNYDVSDAMKEAKKNIDIDGLSSLNTKIVAVQKYGTFVKVLVDVGDPGLIARRMQKFIKSLSKVLEQMRKSQLNQQRV